MGPFLMAGVTGLEPAASAVTGQRSSQLNYHPSRGIADFRLLMPDMTELSPLDLDVINLPPLPCRSARRKSWWAVQDSNL